MIFTRYPLAHLDNRVMDIDGWHWEMAFLGELVEPVYTSHALLHYTTYVLSSTWRERVSSAYINIEINLINK